MGYYTRFNLYLINPATLEVVDPVPPVLRDRVRAAYTDAATPDRDAQGRTYPYWGGTFQWDPANDGDVNGGESAKWYEYEAHTKAVSLKVQDYILCLKGDGEESGDRWVLYAYRGKAYKVAQEPWVPPPPDEGQIGPFYEPGPVQPRSLEEVLAERPHDAACQGSAGTLNGCTCWKKQAFEAAKAGVIEKEA